MNNSEKKRPLSLGSILLVLSVMILALGALVFSGSFYQGVLGLLEHGTPRGAAGSIWSIFVEAFVRDITGEPGIFVSGIKMIFAVMVAFGVMKWASTARGNMSLKIGPVELSAVQSKAVIWCVVFSLLKWL